jgi:hypothetical protein
MTSRDFCFWLQGYLEISSLNDSQISLSYEQIGMIRSHLDLVFVHEIDPSMGDKEHQDALNHIHKPNPHNSAAIPRC